MLDGPTVFLMEFMNIGGDRTSKEKSVVRHLSETSQKWTRNMPSGTKSKTIDKRINNVGEKNAEHNCGRIDIVCCRSFNDFFVMILSRFHGKGVSGHRQNLEDRNREWASGTIESGVESVYICT